MSAEGLDTGMAFEAVHPIFDVLSRLANGHAISIEELDNIPAVDGLPNDTGVEWRISMSELLGVPLVPLEIGALALSSRGVSAETVVSSMGDYGQETAFPTPAAFRLTLRAAVYKLRHTAWLPAMPMGVVMSRDCRPEVGRLRGKQVKSLSVITDWHVEIVEKYLSGSSITSIAEEFDMDDGRDISQLLDMMVITCNAMPPGWRPDYCDQLTELRQQAKRGGYRRGATKEHKAPPEPWQHTAAAKYARGSISLNEVAASLGRNRSRFGRFMDQMVEHYTGLPEDQRPKYYQALVDRRVAVWERWHRRGVTLVNSRARASQ